MIRAVFDSELAKFAQARDILKPGDILKAKVLENRSDNFALVDFGKFRALAEIRFPVSAGEVLLTKVIETGGLLRLSLINPDLKNVAGSNAIIGNLEILAGEVSRKLQLEMSTVRDQIFRLLNAQKHPEHIIDALSRVNSHFKPLYIGEDIQKLAMQIQLFTENSGVFFEKKIEKALMHLMDGAEILSSRKPVESIELKTIFARDLKPNLMVLREFIENFQPNTESIDPKSLAGLKANIDSLLSQIAHQQTMAARQPLQLEAFQIFVFSPPLADEDQKIYLKVFYPKKKTDGAAEKFKISILLKMDRVGEIRTDLLLQKKDLSVTFFVSDDFKKREVENQCPALKISLHPFFESVILKTVVSEKKIREFLSQDLDFYKEKIVDVRI